MASEGEQEFSHVIVVGREVRGKACVHYSVRDECFCTYQFTGEERLERGFVKAKYLVEMMMFLHLMWVDACGQVVERERIP